MSISTGPLELDAGGSVCSGLSEESSHGTGFNGPTHKRHADQIAKLEDNVKTFSYRPNRSGVNRVQIPPVRALKPDTLLVFYGLLRVVFPGPG